MRIYESKISLKFHLEEANASKVLDLRVPLNLNFFYKISSCLSHTYLSTDRKGQCKLFLNLCIVPYFPLTNLLFFSP